MLSEDDMMLSVMTCYYLSANSMTLSSDNGISVDNIDLSAENMPSPDNKMLSADKRVIS
jgi:hypothetical protein